MAEVTPGPSRLKMLLLNHWSELTGIAWYPKKSKRNDWGELRAPVSSTYSKIAFIGQSWLALLDIQRKVKEMVEGIQGPSLKIAFIRPLVGKEH